MTVLPGFPSPAFGAAGGVFAFTMTAGTESTGPGEALTGYAATNSYSTTVLVPSAYGSATGDLSADGGTITDVTFLDSDATHLLVVDGGVTQGLTNINIDGTDYGLSFTSLGGIYDFYTFGPSSSLFSVGTDYGITVT